MKLFGLFKRKHRERNIGRTIGDYGRRHHHGLVSQIRKPALPQSSVMLELLESGCPEETKAAIGLFHSQKQQGGNFCEGCKNHCDLTMPQCKKGMKYAQKIRN